MLKNIKLIMFGIGSISFITGLTRQWPTIGKGYIPFIEGKNYIFFTLGLIIIILGFLLQLFVVGDFNNHSDPTHQVKPEENNIET